MHLCHLAVSSSFCSLRPCTQRESALDGASWSRVRPAPVQACKDMLCSQLSWLTRARSIVHSSPSLFSHCLRFEINLLCEPGDQIALHFNPRFSSSRIVCNSFLNSLWGQEEVNNTFPFKAKEPFQVTLCLPTGLLRSNRKNPANIGVLPIAFPASTILSNIPSLALSLLVILL